MQIRLKFMGFRTVESYLLTSFRVSAAMIRMSSALARSISVSGVRVLGPVGC